MAYDAEAKTAAKLHVAAIRARTVCSQCGGQPIEWHHEDHVVKTNRRVAHLVALGFPIPVIDEEIYKCEAVCRSCHMKEDGRAAALTANRPYKKGQTYVGLLPCANCSQLAKPLRKGLCNACNHKKRKGRLVLTQGEEDHADEAQPCQ